jgi:hypothetical protein
MIESHEVAVDEGEDEDSTSCTSEEIDNNIMQYDVNKPDNEFDNDSDDEEVSPDGNTKDILNWNENKFMEIAATKYSKQRKIIVTNDV